MAEVIMTLWHESQTCELKSDLKNDFLKSVSAFANYDGGEIVFGVANDGALIGIEELDAAQLSISHMVRDGIRPVPRYDIEADEEFPVIHLRVHPGRDTPYLWKGIAYCRTGTSSDPVAPLELRRLSIEGSGRTFDALPARRQDLDFSILFEEVRNALGVTSPNDDTLRTLGLLLPDGLYANAAALLADNNPFPGMVLQRFGTDVSQMFGPPMDLAGKPLTAQLQDAVEFFSTLYVPEEVEGPTRVMKELIPLAAFREAIANALVHRRWEDDARIMVHSI